VPLRPLLLLFTKGLNIADREEEANRADIVTAKRITRKGLFWISDIATSGYSNNGSVRSKADRPCRFTGRWFRLSIEQFDAMNYMEMAPFKIGIILFSLVPYIALRTIG